jgi:phasin family protein
MPAYLLQCSIIGAYFVAEQTQAESTDSKAEALPEAAAPEAVAAKSVKAEPAPTSPTPKKRPAARAATKTLRAKPARKPAARKTKPAKPVRKPARIARKADRAVETGVNIMANRTNKAAETGQVAADQFRAAFGDINARATTAAEKSAKIVEELADLTRGNVEAIVASSKIAAKGVESLGRDAADYGRKSFEDASAALKSFADVKSATDLFRLQGDFARSAFDAAVAESARLSETVLKLAGEVVEPINSRYSVAAERVKTLAA